MKKLLLCGILVFFLMAGGCGSPAVNEADGNQSSTQAEPIQIKLATQATTEQSNYRRIETLISTIEEQSKGAIDITLHPADQLGDYSLTFEEIIKGNIEMAINSIPSTYDSRADAIYGFYIAKDYQEAADYYGKDNFMFSLVDEITGSRNIKFLGFDCLGFGGLGFVKQPEDYNIPGADKKIVARVPATDFSRLYMSGLGYHPVTVNYSDLYSALQTGAVEGWVGGQADVNYLSFGDVIKYYIVTNDFVEMSSIMINQEIWDSLSPELQQIIQTAADELFTQSLIDAKADAEKYYALMEEKGITVLQLSPEELSAHADYIRNNVWPEAEDTLTPEVLQQLQKMVGVSQ
ncbi:MAG: TRAP transporter substrate-binding protein DctP [Clostridiales bacterium]